MTHRRAFLRGLGGTLGAAALSPLVSLDRALARDLDDVARDVSALDPRSDRFAARLREAYLLAPDVIYLNHASIGTIPRIVHEAHKTYLGVCESNPWLYMWGGAWEEPREIVRAKAAAAMGCAPADVAITHNTTEGFNLLAQGLPLGPGDEVLFSSLNHDGASVCFEHHAAARGFAVRRFAFPLARAGALGPNEVVQLYVDQIGPRTRLLVFPHVDNIVGIRHPTAALSAAARARGVEFVAVDGAQTVGMLALDLEGAGVDFYAASPHKWLQAPKGLGLLYARPEARQALRPMWVTWGQARWRGSVRVLEDYGTRNLPALLALGDALDFQRAIGSAAREARHRYLFERMRAMTGAAPALRWGSPERWEEGASLAAITFAGPPAPEFAERMQGRGFVFRPFRTQGINAARISPNLMTAEAEIEGFFALGAGIASGA